MHSCLDIFLQISGKKLRPLPVSKSTLVSVINTVLYYVDLLSNTMSKREENEDPNKTRTTPTTSIQFLCPGRIDDSTVYWDINRNTT